MMSDTTLPPAIRRRGIMLVLSSPSGAGKSTISQRLLRDEKDALTMSISATTRPRRPSEVPGQDYHFITREEFDRMVRNGDFLEHAEVFGNGYGTPRAFVEKAIREGRDILFDIDWQGTKKLRQALPDDLVSIFILPPSIEELERRLRTRAQDSDAVVAKRMAMAHQEISHWQEYDYVVVNDDVANCLKEVEAVLTAERVRRGRREGLESFVRGLGVS
jgi:guanylate kinase